MELRIAARSHGVSVLDSHMSFILESIALSSSQVWKKGALGVNKSLCIDRSS